MAKATTEGGSRNKKPSAGQQRTANDIREAEARKSLTSVKGLASIVGGAILEGVGGPKAKAGKIIGKGVSEIGSIASKAAAERLVRQAARKKVSNVAARRVAERAAGRKAGRLGGEKGLKSVAPKPLAKVTTKSSGGGVRKLVGPAKKIDAQLTRQAEGPSRLVTEKKTVQKGRIIRDVKVTKFEKPIKQTKKVTAEKSPSVPQEKITTVKPAKPKLVKRNKVTITKRKPINPAEVRERMAKTKRDRVRNALTIKVDPARAKIKPKRGVDKNTRPNVDAEDTPQGITVLGKFYRDGNPGLPARGTRLEGTIDSRLKSGAEKARSQSKSYDDKDYDADALVDEGLKSLKKTELKKDADFNPNKKAKRIKPGVRTRTATLIKKGSKPGEAKAKPSEIKGAIRNQRKVLKQREITALARRRGVPQTVQEIKAAEVKKSGSWKNKKGK